MPPTPRAKLLERNPERCTTGHALFVDWSADDLTHLQQSGCLPPGAVASCVHVGEYERVRASAHALGLDGVTFDLPDVATCPDLGAAFDLAVIDLPQGREARELLFHRTAALLAEGGRILVAGETRAGIKPARKALAALFDSVETVDNARRCALVVAEQPRASLNLSTDLDPWFEEYAITVGETIVTVCSLPGIFSHGRLDEGTRLLLQSLTDEPAKRILDVGCGCGVVAAWLHRRRPGRRVELVDCDALAVAAARRTARANGLAADAVRASDVYHEITGQYDLIVSNPPFHRGIATDHGVAQRLISEGGKHLAARGRLRFVANRFLPYPKLLKANFTRWTVVEEDDRFRVYEALKT